MFRFRSVIRRRATSTSFIITFILFLLQGQSAMAQSGCTDPNASNYDAAATTNNGSCSYPATTLTLTNQHDLPSTLNEGSALLFTDGNLWTLNDGGNPAAIYRINPSNGAVLQTVTISNASNTDWEDLAADASYIYIGDFGNNSNGNRTDLRIIRISKADIGNGSDLSVTGTVIPFTYSDQVIENPVTTGPNSTAFDCEAFFVRNGNFHLFTKDWIGGKTKHYTMPATAGLQVANPVEEYNINGLVTGADISADGTIALVGYSSDLASLFMYVLADYSGGQVFNGNKRRLNLGSSLSYGQLEGVSFSAGLTGYVSSEQVNRTVFGVPVLIPPRLYSFDASNLVALPVKSVDFKLSQSNGTVIAGWTTRSESNSAYFILEQSTDSQHFSEIGRIPAAGNSSVSKSYSFTDENPAIGINYYRLKQVDSDGTVTILGIRSITIIAYSGNMKLYPSPANGSRMTFDYGREIPVGLHFQLIASSGAVLSSGSINQRRQNIRIDGLPRGQYFFRLSNGFSLAFTRN